jgi:uncharacterized small protein (DUF1192 family)
MANSRHIQYTITSTSPEPSHVKALVSDYAWNNFRDDTTQVKYTTILSPEALNSSHWNLPRYVSKPLLSAEDLTNLIKKSFDFWASSTNIQFIHDPEQYVLPFYRFTGNFTQPIGVSGHGNITSVAGFASYPHTDNEGIGLNNEVFSWLYRWLEPLNLLHSITHEIGHAGLGLKHPFEPPYAVTKPYEKLKSYSVMNYNSERINDLRIIPTTPMPADIDAAQYLYGINTNANLGDSIHHVHTLAPSHSYLAVYSNMYTTITAIDWDYSGNDTLSAKDIDYDVTLNLRPYSRSKVGAAYLAMPNMDIENLIAGNRKNTLVLNALDNTVDIRTSTQSVVMTDPMMSGHDVIIGFHPNRDTIILESLFDSDGFLQEKPFSAPSHLSTAIINGQSTVVTAATYNTTRTIDDKLTTLTGTKIQFDEKNSLFLADVKPEDIALKFQVNPELALIRKRMPHQQSIPDEENSSAVDISYHFAKDVFFELNKSFLNGAVITFLISLTEDILREAKLSRKQIYNLKEVMEYGFLWYSAPYQTFRILLLFTSIKLVNEFINKKLNPFPLITIINTFNTISSTDSVLYGVCKSLLSSTGYALGSNISLKIKNKLLPAPPESIEELYEESLQYCREEKATFLQQNSKNISADLTQKSLKEHEQRIGLFERELKRIRQEELAKHPNTSGYGRFFKPVLRLGVCALGAATFGPLGLAIGAAGTTIVPSLVNRLHDSCKNYGKATPSPAKSS